MTKFDYILIDANSIIRRCIGVTGSADLTHRGRHTGGLYMAWQMLAGIVARFPGARIAAFFDDGVPVQRTQAIPTYKEDRKRKRIAEGLAREKLFAQVGAFGELLKCLGVTVTKVRGFEADDLVAAAAKMRTTSGSACVVVSSDKDLFQLVRYGVSVWDVGHARLLDGLNFQKEIGLSIEYYLLYRVLCGDASDSIPGVKGCGDVMARRLIDGVRPHESLPTYKQLDDLRKRSPVCSLDTRAKNVLDVFKGDIQRLRDVAAAVDLWRGGIADDARLALACPWDRRGRVDLGATIRFCYHYGFVTPIEEPDRFILPFVRHGLPACTQNAA